MSPANPDNGVSIFVIVADASRGLWSVPLDLEIAGCTDLGRVDEEDVMARVAKTHRRIRVHLTNHHQWVESNAPWMKAGSGCVLRPAPA
ncbi:xylosidase precursor [Xanthomonas vasicola]|uniref:xylosidase precursor n=1 Tax=Xanthomonas vasicola TaxID=56459 RepID=UPI00143A8CCA|nr:xylosidase precursor [Xanthomonas vasicola]MBV6746368.1 xylosidase precursor [Xanthomonas vasicola pv. vasculorum NCPPB 890]MBV6891435.1 xylosidase precursor [Xanthomonas vasicola pv. vasculorum]MDO6948861.1 xylosidase precursor [Xanthomonas vasicola]MDO6950694.1 xylosidase precursor [Xanthomonas vasicola]MDO6961069.1 xylosidase precursor [Xanthomonas vasicola]